VAGRRGMAAALERRIATLGVSAAEHARAQTICARLLNLDDWRACSVLWQYHDKATALRVCDAREGLGRMRSPEQAGLTAKKPYDPPARIVHGELHKLTQTGDFWGGLHAKKHGDHTFS
jgi:hypothetical protein